MKPVFVLTALCLLSAACGSSSSSSGLPGAPGNFTATAVETSVTMNWSAPPTGGAPTSYMIESGSATGLSDVAHIPIKDAATSFSADKVGPGTYFVRVHAVNAAGSGPASNEVVLVVH